jgi:hypothetical protein
MEFKNRTLFNRIIQNLKKLNTFDYIFFFIIILISGIFLFYKFSLQTTWIPVTIKIAPDEWWWQGSSPEPWYANDLNVGNFAYNSFGDKVAEVKNIDNTDIAEGKRQIFVQVLIKAKYDRQRKSYTFNYQPLTVGTILSLSFGTQNIKGVVTFVGDDKPYTEITVEAKLIYVFPWVAEAFKPGISAKDTLGKTVALIKTVDIKNAHRYEFADLNGMIHVVDGEDSVNKDVTLLLRLKTKEYNGVYYYIDGTQIKIGNTIRIDFPRVVVKYAEISAIEN